MERQFSYPVVIENVRDRMKKLLRIAGLNEDLTPHSLRHTHTSLLAETGISLEQIMDRLGHITKNVYLHVTQEMKKEASQKFSELMRSLR
jgi:integrase